ncbi:hypothetical protein AVEN_108785-1 [Araneus ventricosus]|uniref:Uncharacterized protein n=1 Tax=Araneus ventricosus TaxID=182803 RepID=A0A4Y2CCU7_ARAVE|nr:hypothetical protein AVEN_108785-1 [Araneus ventricosus]
MERCGYWKETLQKYISHQFQKKSFKGSGVYLQCEKQLGRTKKQQQNNTLTDTESLQPDVSVFSDLPSSSQNMSLSPPQECRSQSTISSPYKYLKCAKLSTISPNDITENIAVRQSLTECT